MSEMTKNDELMMTVIIECNKKPKLVCEMCGLDEEAAQEKFEDDFEITEYKCITGKWYNLCPDCIPYNEICSVEEWAEKDGTNNYDFEDECWRDDMSDSEDDEA